MRSLMNTDYILRLERGQNEQKSILWMNVVLVASLLAGMVFPMADGNVQAKQKKVLVAYFSATGTTKSAALKIKKAAKGKLYEIKAEDSYTEADLNYDNDDCRANKEQHDESVRPKVKGTVKNIRSYDVIFVGYPIWWGKEPMIIRTFLEKYNLKGKKIVPFCTSGGSGISGSMKGIRASAKGAKVQSGADLTDSSAAGVAKWVKKKVK